MSTAIWIILLVIIFYLLRRQYQIKHVIAELVDAAENDKPYHIHRTASWLHNSGLSNLGEQYNAWREESIKINQQELSHLRQTEATLQNLTEAVILVDSNHEIVLVNPAAQAIFSIPPNYHHVAIEHYVRSAAFVEMLLLIEHGKSHDFKEIALRSNDELHYFEATGALIRDEYENYDSHMMVFVFHDITRMKELENLRKEFVANVSHELRTPLTIIKGFSDALVEDHLHLSTEEKLKFMHKVQNNVNRLNLLLEDLLVLSRLDRGKEVLNLSPTSLRQLIYEVVDDMQSRLDQGKEKIATTLNHRQDRIPIDPIKISQVFHNILDNALRYAKGFDLITIITKQTDSCTQVTISDNGCGIPEKDIPHIFERFYRVDKGRSRELGGTGLGLSIVKHIIYLHGGKISATSREGKGTDIKITIPKEITQN